MRAWPPPRPDRPRGPRAPVLRPQSGVGLRLRSTRDRSADARASPLETQTLLLHCVGGPGGSPCESLGTPVSYRTRNCGPNGSRARSLKPALRLGHRPRGAPRAAHAQVFTHVGHTRTHAGHTHTHACTRRVHTGAQSPAHMQDTRARTHTRAHGYIRHVHAAHTCRHADTPRHARAAHAHTHTHTRDRACAHLSRRHSARCSTGPPPHNLASHSPPNTLRCGLSPREPPASP